MSMNVIASIQKAGNHSEVIPEGWKYSLSVCDLLYQNVVKSHHEELDLQLTL